MNRDQRHTVEAQIKIARLIPRPPKAPDAPLGPQLRDPKDVLSAFTVLQQAFFGR